MLRSEGCPGQSSHPHQACNYIWGIEAQREEGIKTVGMLDQRENWVPSLPQVLNCMSLLIYLSNTVEHDGKTNFLGVIEPTT